MRSTKGVVVALGAVIGLLAMGGCAQPPGWHGSELVSVNAAGTDTGNGHSTLFDVSADGTKVAFVSGANSFGPTDTNGTLDVYVRDLTTGVTTLASVNAAGTDAGNNDSRDPVISPDGTKVAFTGTSTNIGGDWSLGGITNLYVFDLTTGQATLATPSLSFPGSGANSVIRLPRFSPDSTHISFVTGANNLVSPDTDHDVPAHYHDSDVFVRDLATGVTSVVTIDAAGTANLTGSGGTWLSATEIEFTTEADGVVASDGNGVSDIYKRDLDTGEVTLLSSNAAGDGPGNGLSFPTDFSTDGNLMLFTSSATDLGPPDSNTVRDTYLRDLTTGVTRLVPIGEFGGQLSDDGRWIAYLQRVDAAGNQELRIWNVAAGTAQAIGMNPDWRFTFDDTGDRFFFATGRNGFGPTDSDQCVDPDNGFVVPCSDVYMLDLETNTYHLVSANAAGTDSGNGHSLVPRWIAATGQVAFFSAAGNLGPTDTNGFHDVYIASFTALSD